MAIDVKEYMKLTGLSEDAAKDSLGRGDEFAAWRIPGGAAYRTKKDDMESELEADETNAGTIVVETENEPSTDDNTTGDDDTTGDVGAGEGEDEGDGADLD